MDMRWSKALEMVKDREAWGAVVVGWQRIRHHLVTEQQQQKHIGHRKLKSHQWNRLI